MANDDGIGSSRTSLCNWSGVADLDSNSEVQFQPLTFSGKDTSKAPYSTTGASSSELFEVRLPVRRTVYDWIRCTI